ncbi:MAG: TonB family protein [Alphaproteobacteria bacterium]
MRIGLPFLLLLVLCFTEAKAWQPDGLPCGEEGPEGTPLKPDGIPLALSSDDDTVDVSKIYPSVRVAPTYPPALLSTVKEGSVLLALVLSGQGQLLSAEVIHASMPDFGQAALDVIDQWSFCVLPPLNERATIAIRALWLFKIQDE